MSGLQVCESASEVRSGIGKLTQLLSALGRMDHYSRYVSMECRALGGPERIRIANRDISTLHRYCALATELRQSTADGLDGQTEVVAMSPRFMGKRI